MDFGMGMHCDRAAGWFRVFGLRTGLDWMGCVGVQYVTSCGTPFLLAILRRNRRHPCALIVSEVAQGQVTNLCWSMKGSDYCG